eukprot:6162939-Alexandrium_andersonii.AAC.1
MTLTTRHHHRPFPASWHPRARFAGEPRPTPVGQPAARNAQNAGGAEVATSDPPAPSPPQGTRTSQPE